VRALRIASRLRQVVLALCTASRLRQIMLTLFIGASVALSACMRDDGQWKLVNVTGHLPDLGFSLQADNGSTVSGASFAGKTTLVFFGYTHCPDVCPETMARLMQALSQLGDDARDVRILFISVDPHRDTPQTLHTYVQAFDPQHVVGLSGSEKQIANLARRYRVAYQAERPDGDGNYEVMHSSAIYVFDRTGRARLLATATDSADTIVSDLKRLIERTS
jgi:protein SCO1/2